MIQQLVKANLENFGVKANQKVLIAVSAGVDSMVLLHVLHQLQQPLVVAHVNHGVRPESREEAEFLQHWCDLRQITIHTKVLNKDDKPTNHNFQNWARQQRYAFFNTAAQDSGCDFIATAHHLQDRIETFIQHALRGSGAVGLVGLPAVNGNVIRPIYNVHRAEIERYGQTQKLPWREDASNATNAYQRNRIRHQVLPALVQADVNAAKGLEKTLANLQGDAALLGVFVQHFRQQHIVESGEALAVNLEALTRIPAPATLLYYLLHELDSGFDWQLLGGCCQHQIGSMYYGKSYIALRDREALIIAPQQNLEVPEVSVSAATQHVNHPVALSFLRLTRDVHTAPKQGIAAKDNYFTSKDALLDFEKLEFPLTLRKWRKGDAFMPLGMRGAKKVSDYLIDEKVPRTAKESVFVLTSNQNIVWLVGYRIDERYKVGAHTQKMYLARLLEQQ